MTKHFIDYARTIQPLVRLYQTPEGDPYNKTTGLIDHNTLRAEGPRVWCASTECGLGFHGEGDFPHEWLRHGIGYDDDADSDPNWCKTCLGETRGVKPRDREFAEPNLLKEFDAYVEAQHQASQSPSAGEAR